jgi:hypothetical protein
MEKKRKTKNLHIHRIICSLTLLFLMLSFSSCTQAKKEAVSDHPVSPVNREYQRGPVRVKLLLDKDVITLAESLSLTIEADSEEGYEIELPAFGEKLGDFGILDYREEPPRLTGEGRLLTSKVYRLEPFLSGDYKIEPMTIAFRKKQVRPEEKSSGEDAREDSTKYEIQTEEITVKVQSLHGEDRERLQIQPIIGPVDLPRGYAFVWYVLLGVALAGSFVGGGLYWYRRKRTKDKETVAVPSAHELAYRQLEELLGENLPERGELKLFFARISDVVRYYIENRFGLHAPKRTTEEFLTTITQRVDERFLPEHRVLLNDFLHRCDLVKFAEHLPTSEEVRKAIDACKAFIEATKTSEVSGTGEERP